ncbi:TIM29 translocase, partial [Hemiprocne comata]|nr:TIM29 translocase [Hemiprocne comata]
LALIYEVPDPPEVSLYSSRCRHLRRRWRDFPGSVLDVGFLGRWWGLERELRDCDVNEEEFRELPERLRRLHPRQLRSHQ